MQTFLASLRYQEGKISLVKKSKAIQIIDNERLYLLFNGKLLNPINSLEFLAKSYQEKGIDCLKELEGTFTLVIYDKVGQKLFLARDKIGIVPLYFAQTDDAFIFGTELREFSQFINLQINPNSVANYLQFGFVLRPHTIFKSCYKVQSGEYISFTLKEATPTRHTYWSLESCYNEPKHTSSEQEIIDTSHKLLQKSIEQCRQNSHYGLSLSGGYDSATLAAIAQSQSDKKIDTFTIGFHEKQIDEAPFAKAIAKHLGTNHHEHYFSSKDALELIPKIGEVFDEPFADHAASPTLLTSQLLKARGINNLLAGDGGDEVFATADDVHTFERLQKIPHLLKQLIAQPLQHLPVDKIPYLKHYNNFPKKYNKFMEILLAKNIPEMIGRRNTLFLETELQKLIKGYTLPLRTSFEDIDFQGSAQAVDEIIGTYFKTTMVDGELVKSYTTMNHNNIALSTPYLETQLIHYLAKVPSSIKIKNGIKKYILKEITYHYLPKKLMERPKSGFDIPFGQWMRDELKDMLYSQINKERLDKDNIFYTSSILNIRDQFYAGHDSYKYKLWRIFIFQLWYENFSIHYKG